LAEDPAPGGAGKAAPEGAEEHELDSDLVIRLGNESNQNDGVIGPFTYGIQGSHKFGNGTVVEGSFMRLHEPKAPTFKSFVDEAQLTGNFPECELAGQHLVPGITAWKNRMIDMYTNVGGVEVARKDAITTKIGVYSGSATLEEFKRRFAGGQIQLSGSLGPVEIAASYMGGKMESGSYKKSALEFGMDVPMQLVLPLTITAAIENRYYDFGDGGPRNDKSDTQIYVVGLEIHIGELF
jgi:hypothetical protein